MSNEKDFIHEVDEDVRADKLLKLWKEYSNFFYGFVIAILLIVGGTSGYKKYRQNQSMDLANRYTAALELLVAEKYDEGLKALESIEHNASGHSIGYAVMAKLQRASYMMKRQKDKTIPEDSVMQVYWDLSSNDAYPKLYRDYGTYLSAFYSLKKEYVNISKDEVLKRLHVLVEPTNPVRLIALELLAHYQKQDGQIEEARKSCEAVLNDPTPDQSSVKDRCKALLETLPATPESNK